MSTILPVRAHTEFYYFTAVVAALVCMVFDLEEKVPSALATTDLMTRIMFDYYNDIRFQIAHLISNQKEIQLSEVLASTKFSQLGLDLFDIADSHIEIEKYFQIEIPDNVGINSLDDFTDLVYRTTMLNVG